MRKISGIWPRGVVSFTFDDFPKTAFTSGGAILERYGARATYYTAFGLAGCRDAVGEMFDVEMARSVHAHGHELACHTYSHLYCARAERTVLREEVARNARMVAPITGKTKIASFSYPFGAASPSARAVMTPLFSSCRGIQPGINVGVPDYGELNANSIYAARYDPASTRALIDRTIDVGGWLIFYTHDVRQEPSPFGCTPAQLEAVVDHVAQRAPILRVDEVVAQVRYHA
jgi:peptidoglycan/xylan/chitin deacetylase (PgdA/CDA1 family)